ncbi:MAG: undecaprenyl/decaprenyl-phosphate alpha-N-acetylglucosaminyl 1-phosphate transferase [Planctomycetes bacterium]|nr:undecaprenyl/decaprenyl-phosphate alpha-N-acetylglucosaminyl 1-phosphate transferase [Planctomycetota bacterium]
MPWAFAGRVLEPIQVAGISIDLGTASFPFVVLWLVACANVINLVDGLDGLASTICLIVSTTVCALALTTGMHGAAFLAAVVAASLVGFLGHNLPPAKIFLGDSGSLTLGFLIGALSLEASTKRATGLILTVPLVLMSIPIFDTAMAILRRKLNGRSIGEGDRAHIHHRLQDRGLSQSRALLVIAFLCTVMAATAFVSAVLRSEWIGLAICGSVLALLIAGGVFGHEETIHFFHYLRGLGRVLAARAGLLKTELSLAQRDRIQRSRVAALWAELCRRTQGLGGDALELQCRDAATDGLLWRRTWAIQTSASMPSSPDQPRPVAETEAEEMTSSHGEDQASEIDPLQKKPVGWEVAYTVHRAEDLRVVLIAHGTLSRTPPAAALAELLHLSQKLYESWKREDPSDEFPRGPESNPQITNPPAFLRPLPTRSPEPEGPEPEPHRRAA